MFRAIAARIERKAARMGGMMRRLGADPGAHVSMAAGQKLAAASRRCMACGAGEECRRWLDDPATVGQRPDFCPNAAYFATLRRR